MYRIRFHGRGGQGIKTAGRVLGSAFFAEGFEVQDAPRYGAERRGAPLSAYVRAARAPIHERGPIREPDLVVVADDTLVPVAATGVLTGIAPRTTLLLVSEVPAEAWRARLRLEGPVVVLPEAGAECARHVGSVCAAAAARLVGVISYEALARALHEEVAELGAAALDASLAAAEGAWGGLAAHAGSVAEGGTPRVDALAPPDWIELPLEAAGSAVPDVFAAATSVEVRTGLWRTLRPVIDPDRCHRCSWICTSFCPDAAIRVDAAGAPEIDYDHCKGCLVCVAVCPPHAIRAVPERRTTAGETEAG